MRPWLAVLLGAVLIGICLAPPVLETTYSWSWESIGVTAPGVEAIVLADLPLTRWPMSPDDPFYGSVIRTLPERRAGAVAVEVLPTLDRLAVPGCRTGSIRAGWAATVRVMVRREGSATGGTLSVSGETTGTSAPLRCPEAAIQREIGTAVYAALQEVLS